MRKLRLPLLAALGLTVMLGATACKPLPNVPGPKPKPPKTGLVPATPTGDATITILVVKNGAPAKGEHIQVGSSPFGGDEVVADASGKISTSGAAGTWFVTYGEDGEEYPNPDGSGGYCQLGAKTVDSFVVHAGANQVTVDVTPTEHCVHVLY